MSQVCRGVQHAHQKGIIHRDIKPSNVLVSLQDGRAVPKIIDFGIAKATQQTFTERSHLTETQQFIGTPSYMSPEQTGWSEVDVDTRSDVYSLGVLLYELLTGTTPITDETLRRSAFDEICRLIREDVFPLPSSRISSLGNAITTVADNRGSSERQLREKTRGELDWIVMKAIEKDRNRRYDSAADVATDINNYLDQKPIQAAPPSLSYRTNKYLQRNWKFAALVSALAASLMIGTAFSLAGFLTASRELERSRRNLYASDVSLSGQAMRVGNGRLAEEFLLNHVESHPAKDLRTFPWRYMMHRLNQHEAVLAHGSPAHDVFFAENDRYIVSTGEVGRVIVWDAKTRKQLRLIESQISSVKAATMIGESLYIGGRSKKSLVSPGAIEVWNWSSGEKVETIRLDVDFESILHLRQIPKSDYLLIASLNQVVAYDVVQRSIVWQAKLETIGLAAASQTRAVGISHDGTRIATSIPLGQPTEGDTGLFLLDATNGKTQVSLPHIPSIRTVSFSRDNGQLAVGQILPTNQQPLRLIDLTSNAVVTLNTNLAVESAAFSPVDDLLATLNWRGQLMFWNAASGEQLGNVPAHANAPGNLGFSSNGEIVVTCGQDGNVKLWKVSDVLAPEAVAATQPGGAVNWYAFSNDGQSFVSSALMPPTIQHPKRWNVATGELLQEYDVAEDTSFMFSPKTVFSSNDRLLAGVAGTEVYVWDADSGEILNRIEGPKVRASFIRFSNGDKELTVGGIEILDAGKYEFRTRRWDLATESILDDSVKSLELSDGPARDDDPGYPQYRILAGRSTPLTISADRRLFAVALGSEVLLGEAESGKLLHRFNSMQHVIIPLVFSMDGTYLAAAGQSQEIRVWRTDTGEEKMVFEAPCWAGILAFAPDGTTLAAGYYDGSIGFWDLRVEREILHLDAHTFPVTTLHFSGRWQDHGLRRVGSLRSNLAH